MARNDEANDIMAQTSFLYGGNAAYIEQMYARYEDNPGSVPVEWQSFFAELKDDPDEVRKSAAGASWKQANWPVQANGELVSALDGDWGAVEKTVTGKLAGKAKAAGQAIDTADVTQAARDSVRAIMMIRAFRMRGHLHAKLDPLGIAAQVEDYNELSPEAYGFTEADYDRKIFIDHVLGLEYATIREMVDILRRTYCSTLGTSSSCIFPTRKKRPGSRNASKARTRASNSPTRGKVAILQKLIEAEGFEQFIDVKYKGTKRFGLDGGESLIPALEQIIKRGGNMGLKEIVFGMAPPRPPQRAHPGHGEAAPGGVPRVQGRFLQARRCRRLGRRQVSFGRLVGPRVRQQQGAFVADRQPVRTWKSSTRW